MTFIALTVTVSFPILFLLLRDASNHTFIMESTIKILTSLNSEVVQSCPTLCDPIDCSLPGSSVHGIFQARILEWVAISFSMCSLGHKQYDGFPWWLGGKESACNAGDHLHCWICGFDTWVGKIPLKKEMATHSSILTWEIPWTEEPSELRSMGPQRFGHNLATKPPPPPI